MSGEEMLVKSKNKLAVTALREIAEGHVSTRIPVELGDIMRHARSQRERQQAEQR
jgi:DNA-directed RNA polymerase subunit K/omega